MSCLSIFTLSLCLYHIIIAIIIIITSVNKADVMWSFSVILSFVLSFCKQDNWRTPRAWQVVDFWWWCGSARGFRFSFSSPLSIGDFPTFVSISLFSQFSYNQVNQQPIWTQLGEMNDADEFIHNFGTDIRRTSKSRLIRIRIQITFVSNFGVGRDLHSLLQTEHL